MLKTLSLAAFLTLLLPAAFAESPKSFPEDQGVTLEQLQPAPAWASEAVFYQIFPTRFRNGDPKNDPTRDTLEIPIKAPNDWHTSSWTADWYARDDWEKEMGPDFYDSVFDRRYGGDLQGVLDKLDYLSDLGINCIYFNPIFYSRSLHKYDGNSYHHIDPNFGPDPKGDLALIEKETADPSTWKWTAADKLFLKLIKEAHSRKIRVIIDGVFNHTGRDFFAFQNLRKNQAKSPYKDWYVVSSFDNPATKRNEFNYKGWWGHATLPVFAASADGKDMFAGPKNYIMQATKRWMLPDGKDPSLGIDGWRLDVADERPAKFWADWNAFVRKCNPEAYTTAEIWHDAAALVKDGGFSAAMNYNAFTIPVKGFLIDDNIGPSKFVSLTNERRESFPAPVAYVMQNLMGSHDTDRLASMIVNGEGTPYVNGQISFNDNADAHSSKTYKIRKPNDREHEIQRLVVLFQMTYVGAPMIYYGDEAGMWGGHDPDDRMPMVWADLKYDPQAIDPRGDEREADDVNFNREVFDYYKSAVALRREHDALNHGDYSVVFQDNDHDSLAFVRRSDKEKLLVAFNRSSEAATLGMNFPHRKAKPIFVTKGDLSGVQADDSGNALDLKLPPLTGVVLSFE
ncbi:MAG: alpha-glucosidase C-terminal domain-containing protein [Chthoniobacterales bacterium]|nr:alpha-glucosidase C-terminal domain-containing protein [Chthoniobacterales bacterium]